MNLIDSSIVLVRLIYRHKLLNMLRFMYGAIHSLVRDFLIPIIFGDKKIQYYSISLRNMADALDFQGLELRLIQLLRERVRSGEITERSLARVAGVSQPHLHNVLKGKRQLSTAMADQILRRLRLDVFDLLEPGEGAR